MLPLDEERKIKKDLPYLSCADDKYTTAFQSVKEKGFLRFFLLAVASDAKAGKLTVLVDFAPKTLLYKYRKPDVFDETSI